MHKTNVKIKRTEVKYLDPETEVVDDFIVNGRITVVEAKKQVRDLNPDAIYISKETTVETLSIPTDDLVKIHDHYQSIEE